MRRGRSGWLMVGVVAALTLGGAGPMVPAAQAATVIGTVQVPEDPTSVAVSRDGRQVFVANGSSLLAIDAGTMQVSWTTPLGQAGQSVAVSTSGDLVYVGGGSKVVAVDAVTGAIRKTMAVRAGVDFLAIAPDGRTAWALSSDPKGVDHGIITVLDTASGRTKGTIDVGPIPKGILISPSGARAYVLGWASNSIWVINTKSRRVMSAIKVRPWPLAMALNPDGSRLLVSHSPPGPWDSRPITTINTERRAVVGVFRTTEEFDDLAVNGGPLELGQDWLGSGTALVALADRMRSLDAQSGLAIVDLRTQRLVATTPIVLACDGLVDDVHLALAPDATRAYVTHGCRQGPGALTVVDLGDAP